MNFDTSRQLNETPFEHKLRLCRAKIHKEIDLDWQEIADILGLDCHYDHLRKTAYGLIEYDDYLKSGAGAAFRILSISDLHVPHQLPLSVFADYIGNVDILQINGDLLDANSLSKFIKHYQSDPIAEMVACRQYLIDLIQMLNPRSVVINDGNHDVRQGTYLAKRLDNELQELMPSSALEYIFNDGFTHYDRKHHTKTKYDALCDVFSYVDITYTGTWYSGIGKVIFCHPRAFSSGILKTAEKALYWFRNEGYDVDGIVMAHTHRLGQYKIGKSTIYEQGACCHTEDMLYADGQLTNSQKQGFIYVCLDKDGHLIEDKTKLISLN